MSVDGRQFSNQTWFLTFVLIGLTFSVSIFLMGTKAILKGEIPLDFVKARPWSFTAGGGFAAFLITIFAMGFALRIFGQGNDPASAIAEFENRYRFSSSARDIILSAHKCENLVDSWGGRYSYKELNELFNIFEGVGYAHRLRRVDLHTVKQVFLDPISTVFADPELEQYVQCGIRQGPQARWENYRHIALDLRALDPSVFNYVQRCNKIVKFGGDCSKVEVSAGKPIAETGSVK